jgi:TonB family protein
VLREGAVEQKARLISALDPPSNEFAQANGVAGIALYHAVIGSDGKVEEVVAGRPIGFGLDENAAQTIRKATFQPAMKNGKPVRVAVDLVVSFRIYSRRTSQPTASDASQKPAMPALPGPYTVEAAASQASSTRN